MFFKAPLTEWFFVEPKMFFLWYLLKNLLCTFIFKSVGMGDKQLCEKWKCWLQWANNIHCERNWV